MRVCFTANQNNTFMNQWDFVVCNFKPDQIYILGSQDNLVISNPLKEAIFIDSYNQLPDIPLVVAAPAHGRYVHGDINLKDFVHPQDAIYIFGSDSGIMQQEDVTRECSCVYVETDTTDDMYSFVTYAVMMHDRRMKLGYN